MSVVGTIVVLSVPGIRETPLRVLFAFAIVLFLPGYALVTVAFPERSDARTDFPRPITGGIGPIERFVLSVAVSIAIVIVAGFALVVSPVGFGLWAVVFVLSGVTLGATVLAASRRGRLRPEHRYPGALAPLFGEVRGLQRESTIDTAVSILLVVSIVSVGGIVAASTVTPTQSSSTDLFLLAPNGTGQSSATDYPTNLTRGESQPIVVGVTNNGNAPANYTIVTSLQRIDITNSSVSVMNRMQLDEFGLRVRANDTVRERRAIVPPTEGSNLRLAFLLYRGQPPSQPTIKNADREVHLLVNVSASNDGRRTVSTVSNQIGTDLMGSITHTEPDHR
ncbi:DUF1616 domain-containing protein [Halococcus saccharolyticus]|uniref:DUF1616 domain-containing protein n=1 Tax=Halococcus saccharolyticus DSM 5350 TaxID=1227455 RepID=M0MRJ8_9EURY|nr:DUF1616 domain-containing protein [Halococcus saccharolyticus]EMA47065.1 hypothetical protein C449_02652 [Halococcus saccharolyticus DSM 5350]